jgi:hypothetical protein
MPKYRVHFAARITVSGRVVVNAANTEETECGHRDPTTTSWIHGLVLTSPWMMSNGTTFQLPRHRQIHSGSRLTETT